MWIARYGVTFSPPLDFEDQTQYSFTEPLDREFARVDYGSIPPGVSTAWEVLDQRAGQLAFLRKDDPEMVIEPAVDVRVGSLPGRMFSFVAHEKHYKFRVWWAIALLDTVTYVQIIYQASALDSTAITRMQRMLGSVVAVEDELGRPGAPGFARRRAGRIFIDIPSDLEPPATFRFAAGDEDEIQLNLMIRDHPWDWPAPIGVITSQQVETVAVGQQSATVTRFVVTRKIFDEDKVSVNVRSHSETSDGVHVKIDGRAPVELTGRLDVAFRELMSSVGKVD